VRGAALGLLGRRDYTVAELTQTLVFRGYSQDEVDALVRDLVADRTLDDRRIAVAFARTASIVKHRGRVRIRRELEARGIAPAIAKDVVADLPQDDEAAAIERLLTRQRVTRRPPAAERRRLFQQLLRRGFPADAIAAAFKKRGISHEEE
jgi:regulatory protein